MKTLPFWLPRRRRRHRISKKINPAISTAPTTAPTAIPAIAPPDNPFFELEAAAVLDAEDVDVDVGVAVAEEVVKVIKAVIVGRTTPAHFCSALEL